MATEHIPRITIDINQRQEDALKLYIPHGAKKRIFGMIIDDMIKIMDDPQRRAIFLGAIASRELFLDQWFRVPKTTFRKLEAEVKGG